MRYEFILGMRYLLSKRKDRSISIITWISIAGIALGGMALIVSTSVMNGFRDNLSRTIIGALPHIRVFGWEDHIQETEDLSQKLLQIPGVVATAPYILKESLITSKTASRGALIRGIDPQKEPHATEIENFLRNTTEGYSSNTPEEQTLLSQKILSQLDFHNTLAAQVPDGIILGATLAHKLEVQLGDSVKLVSSEQRMTPIGEIPRIKQLQVIGIFESGIAGYDEALAFIDYRVAQKIYDMSGRVTGIGVRIRNPEQAPHTNQVIQTKLPNYLVSNWADENKGVFQIMKIEKFVLFLALTLIVIVAAFNIVSSLTMMVMEKSKDIAILKSLGATNGSIRLIFITQGAIIGTIGTLFGIALGLLGCWILIHFNVVDIPAGVYPGGDRVPVLIDWWYVLTTALSSFLICLLVTIYPSSAAARLDPVEALRYE